MSSPPAPYRRLSDWAGFCSPTELTSWPNGGHLGVITVDLMIGMQLNSLQEIGQTVVILV